MGTTNGKSRDRQRITTYYVGEQRRMTSRGHKGRLMTVLGYDEKKNAVFCAREGISSKWYPLARNERWGGVRPEPITLQDIVPIVRQTPVEYLHELYQIVSGGTQKQNYWKTGDRCMNYLEYIDFLEERAQEKWGRIPLCIQEMSPCHGNSPSPSPESDDESW